MASIFKKKGVWYLDYYLNGKRKRKCLKTSSKRMAKLALSDLEVKLAKNDIGLLIKDVALEKHLEDYLEYKKARLAPSSLTNLQASLNKNIMPFLRSHRVKNLRQITPWLIEKYFSQRKSEGASKVCLNQDLCALRNMLNMAVEWDRLQNNPAAKIKTFQGKTQKTPRYLSREEAKAILDNLQGMWRVLVLTALNTGMRRRELLQLEWHDIDFARMQIRVAHDEIRRTKSKKTRYLPINQELMYVLQSYRQEQDPNVSRLFPVSIDKFRRRLLRAYKNAGVTGSTIHTLRHTFASHLVMEGVDIYTVSKLLGHSDITTTQIYAHLAPDHLKASINRLPAFGHLRDTKEESSKENTATSVQ